MATKTNIANKNKNRKGNQRQLKCFASELYLPLGITTDDSTFPQE